MQKLGSPRETAGSSSTQCLKLVPRMSESTRKCSSAYTSIVNPALHLLVLDKPGVDHEFLELLEVNLRCDFRGASI